MERNEALLRKVGDVIANEPRRYDQGEFWYEDHECGTVACVAGHAALLAHPELTPTELTTRMDIEGEALRVLGLNDGEGGIFHPAWKPAGDPSVPLHERVRDALYKLADGASVEEVTA